MEIARIMRLLALGNDINITNMTLDNNEPTVHAINHRYRDELLVPYIGIENNVQFFLSKGDKSVVTSDGITAKVLEMKERHLCTLEEDIQRIYGISPWYFITRWYNADKRIDSMIFVHLKLSKL